MPKRRYVRLDLSIYNDFQWNANGRITAITSQNGLVSNAVYDGRNRKRAWTSPALPTAQAYQHEWDYDANDNLAQIRYQYWSGPTGMPGVNSSWIRWNYANDLAGRATKIVRDLDASGTRSTELFQYDNFGNLTWFRDADLDVSTIVYDERQLPWVLSEGVGTTDVATRTISYTDDGDIEEIIEPLDTGRTLIERFEYDDFDRNDAWEVVGRERRESVRNTKLLHEQIRIYGYTGGTKTLLEHQVYSYGD